MSQSAAIGNFFSHFLMAWSSAFDDIFSNVAVRFVYKPALWWTARRSGNADCFLRSKQETNFYIAYQVNVRSIFWVHAPIGCSIYHGDMNLFFTLNAFKVSAISLRH